MGRSWIGRSRSPPGGLQTPTGTRDCDVGACREASGHRQARQIVTCEPPKHRHGQCIVTWGASRGSLEASGTPTGPMNREFASSESLKDPPRGACGVPEHVKKPSDSLHGASWGTWDTDKADELRFHKLQEPPRVACGPPEHFKKPNHYSYCYHEEAKLICKQHSTNIFHDRIDWRQVRRNARSG